MEDFTWISIYRTRRSKSSICCYSNILNWIWMIISYIKMQF